MKKALIGFVAVAAIFAARPLAKRMGQKAREHCGEMAAQFAGSGDGAAKTMGPKMREHCEEMAAQFAGRSEAVGKT